MNYKINMGKNFECQFGGNVAYIYELYAMWDKTVRNKLITRKKII